MIRPWKRLRSRILLKNTYIRVDEDLVLLPTGKRKKYYIESRDVRAVAIIAINTKKEILYQREYRHPVGKVIYEFPGGVIEKGETPLAAAKRELEEEAGYIAKRWKQLGTYLANPSRSNVRFWVYQATQVKKVKKNPDPAEFIEEAWIPESRLRTLIKNGTIQGQGMLSAYLLHKLTSRKK